MASSLIPPDGIPVFRFDDGWTWSRVPIDEPVWAAPRPGDVRFRLFDASHRPMLSVTLTPPYLLENQGFGLAGEGLLAIESAEVYRRRVLPLWVSVLNVRSGLHRLKKDEQGFSKHVVVPKPMPDAWIPNAVSLQAEFEAFTFDTSGDAKALFLERLFEGSHVGSASCDSFRVTCPLGDSEWYTYVSIWGYDPPEIVSYVSNGVPLSFALLSNFMRTLMGDHFLVPASQQDAWIDAHSAPGRVLIDFEMFDLMGVPHPVVDVEERFVPWAEAYMASLEA